MYNSLWSEGPKNHLNLKSLVSKIVTWDLEEQCTKDLQGRSNRTSRGDAGVSAGGAPGTSRGGAGVLEAEIDISVSKLLGFETFANFWRISVWVSETK